MRDELTEARQELDQEVDEDRRRELRLEIEGLEKRLDEQERSVMDEILPEAFAAVREAAVRTNIRGTLMSRCCGIALHRNRSRRWKTGEGKTLVATLPLYLLAALTVARRTSW